MLLDQFDEPKVHDVKQPSSLRAPVDKNGEGIKNALDHLTCYKVKPAKDQPKHERRFGIYVNDQFGPEPVDALKEEELGVPSTKLDLGLVRPPEVQ